jgi:hypothetical protein
MNKTIGQDGIELRDWFAGLAMQGMLSGLLADGLDIRWDVLAKDAYYQADLMIEQRKEKKK